jgi:tetratricopeptide (TPR) repeat protein
MAPRTFLALTFGAYLLLTGCVSMEVAREIQSGRRGLRLGSPESAAVHFEAAARLDPDYVTNFTPFDVGVWSYAGRAHYEAGNVERALETFRRAREIHGDDYGRMYLGLLLAQEGKREAGMKELQAGLMGLYHWLETIPGQSPEGKFWDPGGYLRKTIKQTQEKLAAESVDWAAVGDNVRWLGEKLDEEIDEVRRQRRREDKDGHKLHGHSMGRSRR